MVSPDTLLRCGAGLSLALLLVASAFAMLALRQRRIAVQRSLALLQKLGGDSLAEIRPRLATLRTPRLSDLPMSNAPWSFGYE